MATGSAEFAMKASYWGNFATAQRKFPSAREAGIQADQLARMAKEFDAEFVNSADSTRELRKRMGPGLRRLARQSKRVDAIAAKLWGEFVVSIAPHPLTLNSRRALPSATMDLVRYINRKIYGIGNPQRLTAAGAGKRLR